MPDDKCSTTCHYHAKHEDEFEKYDCILNGEHGEVGLVGKVNTLASLLKTANDSLDRLEGRFWKLTYLMLGALGIAVLNLFLLLAKGWGDK